MTPPRPPALAAPAGSLFFRAGCALFAVLFIGLGWDPISRSTWLLENLLVVVLAAVMIGTFRRYPLSRGSYASIGLFLVFHEIGAHYTYSLVPYDALFETLCGRSVSDAMGFDRNHFDRGIHFWYGLLFYFPAREVLLRYAGVSRNAASWLPVEWVLSSSALYELIEWAAAVVFGGDLGIHYLGTQGDVWDAHKDVALALLGSVLAAAGTVVWQWQAVRRDYSTAATARKPSSQLATSGGSAPPAEPV